MKIVFMGTPEFAIPSLKKLYESHHEIVGVVTAPDKPVGRGLKLQPPPVKKIAVQYGLPLTQPEDLKAPSFIDWLKQRKADIFVVVAFRILPPEVFTLPPKGTINLHSSLLPKYRGAAPINWAIINGEKETGVTTIYIEEKVDAGDIILQKKVQIGEDETAGELHDRLANLGAEILLKSLNLIEKDQAPRQKQSGEATRAPKITSELGKISWQNSAKSIKNLIRGLAPKPGAYTFLKGKLIKIYRVRLNKETGVPGKPGEIININKKHGTIEVATGLGSLEILELQPAGKRKMLTEEFLRGYQVDVGETFD